MKSIRKEIWEGKPSYYPYLTKSLWILIYWFSQIPIIYIISSIAKLFMIIYDWITILFLFSVIIIIAIYEFLKRQFSYHNLAYSINNNSICISTKLFNNKEVKFDFNSIQNCRVERKWIDKYFDVGTIIFTICEIDGEEHKERTYKLESLKDYEIVSHFEVLQGKLKL